MNGQLSTTHLSMEKPDSCCVSTSHGQMKMEPFEVKEEIDTNCLKTDEQIKTESTTKPILIECVKIEELVEVKEEMDTKCVKAEEQIKTESTETGQTLTECVKIEGPIKTEFVEIGIQTKTEKVDYGASKPISALSFPTQLSPFSFCNKYRISDYKHCKQERSPSLGQEDEEPRQIKEEQEENWTSQEGEQLQGLKEADTKDSIFTITCVRSLHDQHQSQSPHLNQTAVNREGEPLPSTSTEQMEAEADGGGCGVSEPTSDCQPLSSDHSVAESEDTDMDEDRTESGAPQSGLKTKISQTVKRQSSGISSKGRKSMESSHLKSTSQDAASCKVCGKSFTFYASFMKHIKTHAKDTPCVCGVCGKHVESTKSLVDHLKSHNKALSKTPSKTYSCSICHKVFSSSRAVHMRIHTGEKPYDCKTCKMKFSAKSNLTSHMITHTGERPHICNFCGKGFRWVRYMKAHMRIHTGSKPYRCSLCKKDFSFKFSLRVHMRIHTGERPHSCNVCGKKFIQSSNLKMHMRIHTGERPYSCSVCGNGFILNSDLKEHMRTHTGERPYICSVCGKGFVRSSHLQRHMKTHTGERPYSCSVCRKRFRLHQHVQKHMKTHTGERP